MTRPKLVLIALAALAGICFATWLWATSEPTHHGKRLSVWLAHQRTVDEGRVELTDESVRAVRAIGTNAIPHLLTMLRSPDSQTLMWLEKRLEPYPIILKRLPVAGGTKRRWGMHGFRALGLEARPAIPELVNLVLNSSVREVRGAALNALLPSAQEEAIVLMVEALQNHDSEVRMRAVKAMGGLRQAPHIAVPALTAALGDPNMEVRAMAAGALGRYQEHALSAVPHLESLLSDSNALVRSRATEALASIQAKPVTQ